MDAHLERVGGQKDGYGIPEGELPILRFVLGVFAPGRHTGRSLEAHKSETRS